MSDEHCQFLPRAHALQQMLVKQRPSFSSIHLGEWVPVSISHGGMCAHYASEIGGKKELDMCLFAPTHILSIWHKRRATVHERANGPYLLETGNLRCEEHMHTHMWNADRYHTC